MQFMQTLKAQMTKGMKGEESKVARGADSSRQRGKIRLYDCTVQNVGIYRRVPEERMETAESANSRMYKRKS
jgi:hypothetical protein